MIYLIATCISLAFAMLIKNKNKTCLTREGMFCYFDMAKPIDMILIFGSAMPMFLVAALRYGVGTDYFYTYVPQFEMVVNGESVYYEKGFWLLNKLIAEFTDNPQIFIAFIALLFTALVYGALYIIADNIPMSIVLFVLSYSYFISLNNIRQSLASAILIWSLYYVIEGKDIKAFVSIIIAGLIHQASFIFLVFLVLKYFKFSARFLTVASAGLLVILGGASRLIIEILSKVPRLAKYYAEEEEALSGFLDKSISITFIFVNLCILIIFIYFELQYKNIKTPKWNLILWNQFMILAICSLDGIAPATYRIVRIFSFAQFIYLPNIIEEYEDNRTAKVILYIVLIVLFGALFIQNYVTGTEQVFPYASIFSK